MGIGCAQKIKTASFKRKPWRILIRTFRIWNSTRENIWILLLSRIIFSFCWICSTRALQMFILTRVWSKVSIRGTQRAVNFLMLNLSCNIWSTRYLDMPTASNKSFNLIRRSWSTIWWIFPLLLVVAVVCCPERLSWFKLIWMRLNSTVHLFTVVNHGVESP